MGTQEERWSAIANKLRQQPLYESPVKHEWVELLGRLCRDNDMRLREIGLSELQSCADKATRCCGKNPHN